jgi:Flp pilus assembly protein TadG
VRARSFITSGVNSVKAMSRDSHGSVAVEFALISIPFFMLLFGILETGLIFFGSSMLDKATADAARLVKTGQVQAQNMSASQFHDYICTEIAPLLSCGSSLQVDVEAYSNFDSVSIANPVDNKGNLNSSLNKYAVGGPGSIVLVRTFYTWNIVTPLLKPFFANLSNGQHLLTSTAAFRNEPF